MLNSLPKLISDELFLHRAEILPGLPWETIARLCTYYIMIYKSNEHLPENIEWWRHQMETFSALLAICAGNSPVTGEFPIQRPVTRSFEILFDLRLNKRWSKHSWGWWFETLSCPLWRHCNGNYVIVAIIKYALTHRPLETHGCVLSTMATDALVLKHHAVSIDSGD